MLIYSQRIEYHDLTHTKGMIALNLGPIRLTSYYNNLIHIINVTNLEISFNNIKITILSSNFNTTNLVYNPKTLKCQLNRLQVKIDNLKPLNRRKRGLIDRLGTIIK